MVASSVTQGHPLIRRLGDARGQVRGWGRPGRGGDGTVCGLLDRPDCGPVL